MITTTLEFPAYTTATHRITLRRPEMFNTDAVSGGLQTMIMASGTYRTYAKTVRGRLFTFTFNIYCKTKPAGATVSGMLGVVQFFSAYNGNYLKYTDEDSREWILQLLGEEVEIDRVSHNHWQFEITGLRFEGTADSGSGGNFIPTLGGVTH